MTTTKRSPSIRTWPRFGRRQGRRRKLLAAQIGSRKSHRRRGCIRGTGSRIDRLAGRSPVLTRCWGCTSRCLPAATMCGRQTSEPSSSRGWQITRCTANPSCPQQVSPRWCWPPVAKRLVFPCEAITVNRLEVEQMLPLDSRTQVTTQLVRSADNSIRVEIHSRSAGGNWCRHAVAGVEVAQQDAPAERPVSPR